jgi:tetratricopeptide (TPR) repeat protein
VTFLAYLPSLGNGYAMDDRLIAMGINQGRKNPMIHQLRPVRDYFESPYWRGHVDRDDDTLYRPVTVWSHALVHRLFRPSEIDPTDREQKQTALPQHLVNVLLHLLALVLIHGLLRRLAVPPGPALAGVLVFGLHAVHSEVVATVVGRAELLAFTFGAAAVLVLFGGLGRSLGGRIAAGGASALLMFLAFCSKESALAWIGFVPVYGLAARWRADVRDRPTPAGIGLMLVPALAAAVVFLVLRHRVVGHVDEVVIAWVVNPLAHADPASRVFTAVFVWGTKGLGLTLFPFELACTYGAMVLPIVTSPIDPRFWLIALLLLGLVAGGVLGARRRPLLFLATAVFFGFSLITSNVFFPIGTIFGERLYYAPSLAVAIVFAWLFERLRRRPSLGLALGMATGVWLGASALVILERNPIWENDETLFLHEVRNQPRSTRMHICAATIHGDRGEVDRAEAHLREALRLDPEYALAWNNLGALYLEAGRLTEAEECLRFGLRAGHVVEKEDLFKLRCNLGLVQKALNRPDEAFVQLAASLRSNPTFERAWTELVSLARSPGAAERLRSVLRQWEAEEARAARWPYYRGRLAQRLGRSGEAEAAFHAALARDPGLAEARIRLIELLHASRPEKEVIDLIEEGEARAPGRPEWPYWRGRLSLRAGRPEAAIPAFVKSLDRGGEFSAAWEGLLGLAENADRLASVLEALERAEAERPRYPYWPFFRGQLLERQEKRGEAMDAQGRALAARPTFVPAWRDLVRLASGPPDANRRLLDVVELAADASGDAAPEWSYFRGIAYKRLGDLMAAAAHFEEALRRKPDFLDARLELVSVVLGSYDPDDVLAIVGEGLIHHPANPHWPLYRGLVLHREHRDTEAVSALEAGLKGLPGHVDGRLALAACLARLGRKQPARAIYLGLARQDDLDPSLRSLAAEKAAALGSE